MATITRRKRTYTPEQLAHKREYLREYRKLHPDTCKRWRDAYILRRAARLQAEAEGEAVTDRGGN